MHHHIKRLSVKHKNNKLLYYSKNVARQLFPGILFRSRLHNKLTQVKCFDQEYLRKRLNYYNKLENSVELSPDIMNLEHFKMQKKNKTYFFDTFRYTRFFSPELRFRYEFGDVTYVPSEPAIVKSRPIMADNSNSVVLNLDKVRHFTFVNDKKDFSSKNNILVSRNEVGQAHRIKFLEMYLHHPMCNIGKINNDGTYPELVKEYLTIDEQLEYKFILCLEGNDVASNLKWVMSSHSLAVMPLPKFETWFMEGTLIPNYHYVLIKDDYSDLEERLKYFIEHEDEARQIIKNANDYITQFQDRKRENLLSLLVLEKYFYRTKQIPADKNIKPLLVSD